jgi:hypothetical protein
LFSLFPPGFPAVPRYFDHTSVGPSPSQNRTCGFPASGSSNRLTSMPNGISDSRFSFVNNLLPDLVAGKCFPSYIHLFVNPFPPPALPDLIGIYGLIRLPVPLSLTSFPWPQVPPCRRKTRVLQGSYAILWTACLDYDPGGVSIISPLTMIPLLSSVFLTKSTHSTS